MFAIDAALITFKYFFYFAAFNSTVAPITNHNNLSPNFIRDSAFSVSHILQS